jgi:hypothetical protein
LFHSFGFTSFDSAVSENYSRDELKSRTIPNQSNVGDESMKTNRDFQNRAEVTQRNTIERTAMYVDGIRRREAVLGCKDRRGQPGQDIAV